jgi:hypothetical protein
MVGIKNIITFGYVVCGQVDIIDFQSMPDGLFKFLLNYIDHGVKKLTLIPLVAKRPREQQGMHKYTSSHNG